MIWAYLDPKKSIVLTAADGQIENLGVNWGPNDMHVSSVFGAKWGEAFKLSIYECYLCRLATLTRRRDDDAAMTTILENRDSQVLWIIHI